MTIEAIDYRRCDSPDDLTAIRRLFADARELSSYASHALDAQELIAWIAEAGGTIVGAILTRRMRSEDGAELGGVDELLVAASHRGRRMGARLMELAEAHYQATGADGMQLTVREDNESARGLYESMGYSVVQRRLRMQKRFPER